MLYLAPTLYIYIYIFIYIYMYIYIVCMCAYRYTRTCACVRNMQMYACTRWICTHTRIATHVRMSSLAICLYVVLGAIISCILSLSLYFPSLLRHSFTRLALATTSSLVPPLSLSLHNISLIDMT